MFLKRQLHVFGLSLNVSCLEAVYTYLACYVLKMGVTALGVI